MVVIGLFNASAIFVTKRLNAVVRSILETLRSLGVWAVSLALGAATGGAAGEAWAGATSAVEAAGFALLLVGTFVYKASLERRVSSESGVRGSSACQG